MLYEAVKVNMVNSSFNKTISSTLSFITVLFEDLLLFEDLFEAINIHKEFGGEKENPKPSVTPLNKTNTCDGYDFNIDIIMGDQYNGLQRESLMCFEAYCIFGFRELFKNLLCILMEVIKTMYEYNDEDVQKILWTIFIQNHANVILHLRLCGMSSQQMKIIVSIDNQ